MLMERTRGPFAAVASDMENELLGGNITLDATAGNGYPENNVPARRKRGAAAPVLLNHLGDCAAVAVPKHIVDKSGFLIIEEPEAHLHPASQLVLAKYIVRLIRGGASILMTTHSVFLA